MTGKYYVTSWQMDEEVRDVPKIFLILEASYVKGGRVKPCDRGYMNKGVRIPCQYRLVIIRKYDVSTSCHIPKEHIITISVNHQKFRKVIKFL